MDKDEQEKLNQKKNNEKFNSITQKVKPENQNQTHNVRSEAVEPKIRQVWAVRKDCSFSQNHFDSRQARPFWEPRRE